MTHLMRREEALSLAKANAKTFLCLFLVGRNERTPAFAKLTVPGVPACARAHLRACIDASRPDPRESLDRAKPLVKPKAKL
jgi:hypothetical protein